MDWLDDGPKTEEEVRVTSLGGEGEACKVRVDPIPFKLEVR
jgi:hypothetical protein